MVYKNFVIERELFGYVVCYCGDEIIFDTVEQAKEFIDSIN